MVSGLSSCGLRSLSLDEDDAGDCGGLTAISSSPGSCKAEGGW